MLKDARQMEMIKHIVILILDKVEFQVEKH